MPFDTTFLIVRNSTCRARDEFKCQSRERIEPIINYLIHTLSHYYSLLIVGIKWRKTTFFMFPCVIKIEGHGVVPK